MTSSLARPNSASGTSIVHRGEVWAGPFMVTLCRLVEPVSIRPPQAAHLKPFTFFTSRTPQQDGSEHLYLHMGFFETLAHADRWARAVRGRHPGAIATRAPRMFWQVSDADGGVGHSPDPAVASSASPQFAPVPNASLTDTQVINILQTRQPAPAHSDGDEQGVEHIELLRPDDTGTRRALKEAVAQGAPVSFAVQLYWSVRSIEPDAVPQLEIFKAYTLYAVESRRANRSCFFLRLGFFGDPVSAKQVAFHVRSSFGSAAVVPVLDEEIERARACMDMSIPCFVQQHLAQPLDFGGIDWAEVGKPESGRRRSVSLEETLSQLAEREMWSDPDLTSDTGVRHIKVEVEKRPSSRKH